MNLRGGWTLLWKRLKVFPRAAPTTHGNQKLGQSLLFFFYFKIERNSCSDIKSCFLSQFIRLGSDGSEFAQRCVASGKPREKSIVFFFAQFWHVQNFLGKIVLEHIKDNGFIGNNSTWLAQIFIWYQTTLVICTLKSFQKRKFFLVKYKTFSPQIA